MKKRASLILLCCCLIWFSGCNMGAGAQEGQSPQNVEVVKKPFSKDPGWFNQKGISVFYMPTKDGQVEQFGLVDKSGKTLFQQKAENGKPTLLFPAGQENVFSFRQGDHYGLMDEKGKILLEPISEKPITFEHGVGSYDKEGRFGIIKKDMTVTPLLSDSLIDFGKEDVAPFSKDGKWGVVDREGNIIVQPIYDWISYPGHGKLMFRRGDQSGWMLYNGREIPDSLKPIYMVERLTTSPGNGIYMKNGKYGLVGDDAFAVLTPPISDELFFTNLDGYGGFVQAKKCGIFHFGDIIKQPFSDMPLTFDINSVSTYQQGGQYGFIKGDGTAINVPKNDKIGELTEAGYAVFYKDGKAGILKDDGSVFVEPFCDDMKLQSGSDLIWYKDGGLWGFAKLSRTM